MQIVPLHEKKDKPCLAGARYRMLAESCQDMFFTVSAHVRLLDINDAGLFRLGDESTSSAVSSEVTVLDVSDHRPRRVPSKTWRELIKKIWEVDPLSCPRCGYGMKLISLIHEPDVIERILRRLGSWKQYPDPPEGRFKAPEDGPVVMENFDDGWPGYEKPVIIWH